MCFSSFAHQHSKTIKQGNCSLSQGNDKLGIVQMRKLCMLASYYEKKSKYFSNLNYYSSIISYHDVQYQLFCPSVPSRLTLKYVTKLD